MTFGCHIFDTFNLLQQTLISLTRRVIQLEGHCIIAVAEYTSQPASSEDSRDKRNYVQK